MKNSIITFLFSAISFCCLAQTPFTEQTLLDMNKRMMQDFAKFMLEEVSPDYTFTTEDGALISYQAMKDLKIKVLEWNTHDLKIKQIGNATIVRGINKNTIQSATSGAIRKYNLQFMYTYEYKNGKWLWFSSHHIYNNPNTDDKPEEIVKQWIAEYNKDTKAFFMDKCTDDFIASNTNNGGKFFGKEFVKGLKEGQPADADISDMKAFQSGNLAVVMGIMTWHHKQADGSDKPDKTVSTFVMQKKSGKWMYAGYHSSALKE